MSKSLSYLLFCWITLDTIRVIWILREAHDTKNQLCKDLLGETSVRKSQKKAPCEGKGKKEKLGTRVVDSMRVLRKFGKVAGTSLSQSCPSEESCTSPYWAYLSILQSQQQMFLAQGTNMLSLIVNYATKLKCLVSLKLKSKEKNVEALYIS